MYEDVMPLWGFEPVDVAWNVDFEKPHAIAVRSQAGQTGHTLTLTVDGRTLLTRSLNYLSLRTGEYGFRVGDHRLSLRWIYPGESSEKPDALALLVDGRVHGIWGDTALRADIARPDFVRSQGRGRRTGFVIGLCALSVGLLVDSLNAAPGRAGIHPVVLAVVLVAVVCLYFIIDVLVHGDH